jgi:hypothetical protein
VQLPRALWITVTVAILLAWLANLVVGWADLGRTDPAVNFIFGAVISSLYVVRPKAAETTKNIIDAMSRRKDTDEKPPRGDKP